MGLDFFRIVLALLVFLFHSIVKYDCDYGPLTTFFRMGAIAMTGFMVLSGYVLSKMYNYKNMSVLVEIKKFYLKRIITLFPLYYFIAFIATLIDLLKGNISAIDTFVLFPIELLGLQSVFSSLFNYSHNGGTWFISCILICYLVFPFILLIGKQLSNKGRIALCLLCTSILLWSPFVQIQCKTSWIYPNPFFRLLEFSIGSMVYMIQTSTNENLWLYGVLRKRVTPFAIFTILISVVTIARNIGIPGDKMLFNWIALPSFVLLIVSLSYNPFRKWQNNKVILYFSNISFTFFLCQVLPIWKVSDIIGKLLATETNISKILISFIMCLVGSCLIHELIENPISNYLRKKLLR